MTSTTETETSPHGPAPRVHARRGAAHRQGVQPLRRSLEQALLSVTLGVLSAGTAWAGQAFAALPGAGPVPVATDPECSATILDRETRQTLYRMTREHEAHASGSRVLWRYTDLEGETAAEETIAYGPDGRLERYDLHIPGADEHARVEVDQGHLEMVYAHGGDEDEDRERYLPEILVNDQVVPLLQRHWQRILQGETLTSRVVVPSHTRTLEFSFEMVEVARYGSVDAIVVEMKPSSWIIAQIVDPFRFTLERGGAHRLLEFDGRTTPKRASMGDWDDLDAVVVYRNCFAAVETQPSGAPAKRAALNQASR